MYGFEQARATGVSTSLEIDVRAVASGGGACAGRKPRVERKDPDSTRRRGRPWPFLNRKVRCAVPSDARLDRLLPQVTEKSQVAWPEALMCQLHRRDGAPSSTGEGRGGVHPPRHV